MMAGCGQGGREGLARMMGDHDGGGPEGLHQLPIAGQRQEILDIIGGKGCHCIWCCLVFHFICDFMDSKSY